VEQFPPLSDFHLAGTSPKVPYLSKVITFPLLCIPFLKTVLSTITTVFATTLYRHSLPRPGMAILNSYLAYKRDTSQLIYWIVTTSNAIIISSSPPTVGTSWAQNTTGSITVAGLVSLSKLIAKHVTPIPHAILCLFDSVIQARSNQYKAFTERVADNSDPEIEQRNSSHKHFINALSEAFEALGGLAWAKGRTKRPTSADTSDDQADLEQVLFANRFETLSLNTKPDEDEEQQSDHELEAGPPSCEAPRRRQPKRSSGKGKKSELWESIKEEGRAATSLREPGLGISAHRELPP